MIYVLEKVIIDIIICVLLIFMMWKILTENLIWLIGGWTSKTPNINHTFELCSGLKPLGMRPSVHLSMPSTCCCGVTAVHALLPSSTSKGPLSRRAICTSGKRWCKAGPRTKRVMQMCRLQQVYCTHAHAYKGPNQKVHMYIRTQLNIVPAKAVCHCS